MAFFFSMRRTSLFDTNQRLLRSWLSSPLRMTFFLKRLKSCSCDSFGRKLTDVIEIHLLAGVKSLARAPDKKATPSGRRQLSTNHASEIESTWEGKNSQSRRANGCIGRGGSEKAGE